MGDGGGGEDKFRPPRLASTQAAGSQKKYPNMPLQILFKHLQSIYEYFIFCGWWRLFGVVSETNLKLIGHAKQ